MTRSGYVLVGGRSTRMGRDKARLPYRGTTLSESIAREVELAAGSVTRVGDAELGIADLYPGEGPLGGILTALQHSKAEANLVVACDMPFADSAFLRRLLDAAEECGADALLPRGPSGRPEPLCAVYHCRAFPVMMAHFSGGTRKVTAALEGLATVFFDVEEVALFQNLNTPEDWAAYAGE